MPAGAAEAADGFGHAVFQSIGCKAVADGNLGKVRDALHEGREVVDNLVTVPDFNATIATALGIPLEKKTMSPSMRPFTVADKGEPIMGLFS